MGCAGFSGVKGATAAASAGRGDSPPVLLGKTDAGDGKADARDGKADAQQRLTVGPQVGSDLPVIAEAEEAKASSSPEEDGIVVKLGQLDRLQKKGVVEMIDATGAASAPRMSIGSVTDLGQTSFAEKGDRPDGRRAGPIAVRPRLHLPQGPEEGQPQPGLVARPQDGRLLDLRGL